LTKPVQRTGEQIPVIGMGTWLTFNVPTNGETIAQRAEVLRAFFEMGGGMVDSSPMYGNAEAAVGACLQRLGAQESLFAATKIWSFDTDVGQQQFDNSEQLWGLPQLDLQQVHNLVSWREYLPMLRAAKDAGRIRYIGVTTSHGRRHDELARILKSEPLDFVQLTYNLRHTEAESLIELAAERGVAVIVNRPLDGGRLIEEVQKRPLPEWAGEMGIVDWPDFLLRWIVSHPAVTCAIPATTQVEHMRENMAVAQRRRLEPAERARMQEYIGG
jgi:diketogulonate reductase-like aldo/keto reductase